VGDGVEGAIAARFTPQIDADARGVLRAGWDRAVAASIGLGAG
jgi:hypothetical protein